MSRLLESFKQAVTEVWNHTPREEYLTRKELDVAIRIFVFLLGEKVLNRVDFVRLEEHYRSLKNTKKDEVND